MSPIDRSSAVLDEPEVHFDPWPARPLRRQVRHPSVRFQLLEATHPERKRWWTSFGAGTAIQAIIVLLVVTLSTILRTVVKPPPLEHKYIMVRITSPPLPRPSPTIVPSHKPAVIQPVPPKRVATPKPVFRAEIPAVAIARPAPKPIFKQPKFHVPVMRSEATNPAVPKWKPKVAMGKFATNSPLPPTTQRPARSVQTGGFGDPNGFRREAQSSTPGNVNVPKLGTFGSPDGPGHGNGSGGATGARALVASAGFGSADPAGSGASVGANSGTVHSGGFGDASLRARAPQGQPRQARNPSFQAVEILSKPNPVYTDEARRLHIQGQVILDVVFTASGEVQVVRVVRGLGHGLDQAAIDDAHEIRFRPARRGGSPVNTAATLRILFQLAD